MAPTLVMPGPTLSGKLTHVVVPAELIAPALINKLAKHKWSCQVVLIANSIINSKMNVVYHNNDKRLVATLAKELQLGSASLAACGNDLRQMQILKTFDYSDFKDVLPRTYFDSDGLLKNRHSLLPDYVNIAWIEKNIMANVPASLLPVIEKFYADLTDVDNNDYLYELRQQVVASSLGNLQCTRTELRKPEPTMMSCPSSYKEFDSTNPCCGWTRQSPLAIATEAFGFEIPSPDSASARLRTPPPPQTPQSPKVNYTIPAQPMAPRGEHPINFEGAAPLWTNDLAATASMVENELGLSL